MLQQTKLNVAKLLSHPHARVILIVGTLIVAALAGGAPNDMGGAGG